MKNRKITTDQKNTHVQGGKKRHKKDTQKGPVAQLDRAFDYGSKGLGFESLRVRKVLQSHTDDVRLFEDHILSAVVGTTSQQNMDPLATYSPAIVKDRGGDLSKEWHVEFRYFDQQSQCLKRLRETGGANREKTAEARMKILVPLAREINRKLAKGWDPNTGLYKENVIYSLDSWECCVPEVLRFQSLNFSHQSFIAYKYTLRRFTGYLEMRNLNHKHPKHISKQIILDYLNWRLMTKRIKKSTRDKDLVLIRATFNHLRLRGVVTDNPAKDIAKLGDTPNRNEAYTPAQLKAIIEYLNEHDPYLLAFCCLVMAAVRPAEILRLQIKDINQKEGTVRVEAKKAKNAITRVARIPSVVLPYFQVYDFENHPPHFYAFSASMQPQPKMQNNRAWYTRKFKEMKKALGLSENHTMYSLKHTILSMMYEGGATQQELQSFGGFQTLDALQAYLRSRMQMVPNDPSHLLKF